MTKKILHIFLFVIVALAFVLIFTNQVSHHDGHEILVLCGGSMRGALETIKERYEQQYPDRIVTTYGDSGSLCAQIQNTGQGDVYLCHDPFMPWAHNQGLISEWATVAALDVVIVVPKGNPKNIQTLQDLGRSGLRVGIGNQTYSSSGQIMKHMLAGQDFGPGILKNVRVETKGHQQRCQDVAMGILDTATVWNAVARQYQDKLEIIPIPKTYIDSITSATYGVMDLKYMKVTAGIIAGAKEREAAQRFYRYLTHEGKAVFTELGFSPVRE